MRWAVVPKGDKTCGWCFMLACRGFDYKSEETLAASVHDGCDCEPMVGYSDTTVEDFDVEGMAKRWADCVRTVGGILDRGQTRAIWDTMTEDERKKYKSSFDRFHQIESTRAAREEVERRDPRWLYGGPDALPRGKRGHCWDDSLLTDSDYRRLKEHEIQAWDTLAENHGLIFTVLPEDPIAKANIDAKKRGFYWELKNPKDGKHAIEDMAKDARSKWERLMLPDPMHIIYSGSLSHRTDEDLFQETVRRAGHYGFSELIYVYRTSDMIRRICF